MHQYKNNSSANVYHLEQMVDNFFPYSQKQLGFDKPATIVFHSDEQNANTMLGKTAYYDPENYEVYLFVDKRHPKDILRSLSHELVHHAQNCRGDLDGAEDAAPGYAQHNPHMRKMEREAYTKGNLIFRDFEDLIKTGKINIEIDFSDSGEPEMSLREWKNNEINMKLMKKWGLLKEATEVEALEEEADGEADLEEEQAVFAARKMSLKKEAERADTPEKQKAKTHPSLPPVRRGRNVKVSGKQQKAETHPSLPPVGKGSGKISVREAKELTRRILERIRKENN